MSDIFEPKKIDSLLFKRSNLFKFVTLFNSSLSVFDFLYLLYFDFLYGWDIEHALFDLNLLFLLLLFNYNEELLELLDLEDINFFYSKLLLI